MTEKKKMRLAKMASDAPAKKRQRGFADAMDDLTNRKLAELTGKDWAGRHEYFRMAEAKRRARKAMVARIKKRTGKTYAPSTLERKAAKNELPAGVDMHWLNWWAYIDRAGSIEAVAAKLKKSPAQIAAMRDRKPSAKAKEPPQPPEEEAPPPGGAPPIVPPPPGGKKKPPPGGAPPIVPPPPGEKPEEEGFEDEEPEEEIESEEPVDEDRLGPGGGIGGFDGGGDVLIGVDVIGTLCISDTTEEPDKRIPTAHGTEYEWIWIDEDTAQELLDAQIAGDDDEICNVLSRPLSDIIVEWDGVPPMAYFRVDEVISLIWDEQPPEDGENTPEG
ncbi:Uncharacterised protein [Mycobacteroides abscessus subsp. abscessus]|uniref:hypothetical protein n=1 Tax=Mycobacteroides abscessus TaxID=36809 RepID=UPI000927F36F|nr:hypothetical protein [Mycobacteroides abscessus]SHY23721.1 Uncharacterised protein [Mycobacteroides abscessus subsp. abscessus]SIC83363.1 Uncharacterised protein [Mycobacteroides abscessus subsp. abscessus]SKP23619.1 Uncharacterised protein [Mycobacteroides abscessus subsp. abscessus]